MRKREKSMKREKKEIGGVYLGTEQLLCQGKEKKREAFVLAISSILHRLTALKSL